jgi:hypothetical protein
MQDEERTTEGYIGTKRFLNDYPEWLPIVKACVVVAERGKGEFPGAWVFQEAQEPGIEWFRSLRRLASYKILRRTHVARRGRRAYYIMPDIEGVKAALKEFT